MECREEVKRNQFEFLSGRAGKRSPAAVAAMPFPMNTIKRDQGRTSYILDCLPGSGFTAVVIAFTIVKYTILL